MLSTFMPHGPTHSNVVRTCASPPSPSSHHPSANVLRSATGTVGLRLLRYFTSSLTLKGARVGTTSVRSTSLVSKRAESSRSSSVSDEREAVERERKEMSRIRSPAPPVLERKSVFRAVSPGLTTPMMTPLIRLVDCSSSMRIWLSEKVR